MARGIATPRMVAAAVRAGLLGFYGSAGLRPDTIAQGLAEIEAELGLNAPAWGANLIHSPQQPGYETAVVDLFMERRVRRVSASAFMGLSPDVVRYTALGLARGPQGDIVRANHVFAKVSRAEVAAQFMAPAPGKILRELVSAGRMTETQADLASQVPVAAEITAEADSGGHTDNRPAGALFASICEARRRVCEDHNLDLNGVRIGLAGGIGTPHAAAAAFQMGAAYILTGSINQAAIESGLSDAGRRLLTEAGPTDVMMTPAADMFEQGVKVQVLKRGTLFAVRGAKLAEIYRQRSGFSDLTADEIRFVETALGESIASAWDKTRTYLSDANPDELAKGLRDPKKQMALVFRRYLFMGSQWAREGEEERLRDFQIWCGPAMGAFNEWVHGTPLEPLEARTVKQIAWNLLDGAARLARAQVKRASGLPVPPADFEIRPVLYR